MKMRVHWLNLIKVAAFTIVVFYFTYVLTQLILYPQLTAYSIGSGWDVFYVSFVLLPIEFAKRVSVSLLLAAVVLFGCVERVWPRLSKRRSGVVGTVVGFILGFIVFYSLLPLHQWPSAVLEDPEYLVVAAIPAVATMILATKHARPTLVNALPSDG